MTSFVRISLPALRDISNAILQGLVRRSDIEKVVNIIPHEDASLTLVVEHHQGSVDQTNALLIFDPQEGHLILRPYPIDTTEERLEKTNG